MRLIPSLNGGLYKFDGDNLEPVPVSTDRLLRSSFRYSDDLVFSGGKETRSYGIISLLYFFFFFFFFFQRPFSTPELRT